MVFSMENRRQLRSLVEGHVSIRNSHNKILLTLDQVEISRTSVAFLSNINCDIGTEINVEITKASPWPDMYFFGHVCSTSTHIKGYLIELTKC